MVVVSLDGLHATVLIETEISLQLVESESQQHLHSEWWENEVLVASGVACVACGGVVQLNAVIDGHGGVPVAHIHTTTCEKQKLVTIAHDGRKTS